MQMQRNARREETSSSSSTTTATTKYVVQESVSGWVAWDNMQYDSYIDSDSSVVAVVAVVVIAKTKRKRNPQDKTHCSFLSDTIVCY